MFAIFMIYAMENVGQGTYNIALNRALNDYYIVGSFKFKSKSKIFKFELKP